VNRLRELPGAETGAGKARRAAGAIPDVLRPPGAAAEAYARWEQAHAACKPPCTSPGEKPAGDRHARAPAPA